MGDTQEIQILTEIREQLKATNNCLCDIKTQLTTDRNNIWKVLMITIAGAFALVGIKLLLP